jgi:hypothetical protein
MLPLAGQSGKPIIITIAEPPSELGSLGRVLLGSLGLAGTLILIAVSLALVLGGVMFWIRSRGNRESATRLVE